MCMISPRARIYQGAVIEQGVAVHDFAVNYPDITVRSGAEIFEHCVIGRHPKSPGCTSRNLSGGYQTTVIGEDKGLSPRWKVLITSIGTATSVNLIKYFRRLEDIKIVGVDINAYGFTAGSTMVDSFYQVPYAIDEGYLPRILEIAEIEGIDCLIPINDLEVKVFANEKKLPFTCIIPSGSVVEEAMDKKTCTNIINSIGCTVPPAVAREEKVKRIVRDIWGVGSSGISIYEADDTIVKYDPDKQFIQQFISGQEYTVDILSDRNGTPIYIIPRKRIEVKAGIATKVLIENNEKLIALTRKICDRFSIPGFSNVQFIERNGEYYFIEINCRFSGCGSASALVCPNLLDDFTKIIKGEKPVTEFNQNIKWNSIVTRYFEEVMVPCGSF